MSVSMQYKHLPAILCNSFFIGVGIGQCVHTMCTNIVFYGQNIWKIYGHTVEVFVGFFQWIILNRISLIFCLRYMQYGSYPVVNPINETYPDKFNLHRTALHHIAIALNETRHFYKIDRPLPGSWFAITFINDYVDEKLTVQVCYSKMVLYFKLNDNPGKLFFLLKHITVGPAYSEFGYYEYPVITNKLEEFF